MSRDESPTPKRQRILSGVQPTGRLHLGNYFGAIKQHIDLQQHGECYYFIANYHSLTTLRDGAALRAYTRDVAITYLALGLDPERTVFYRQSDVPEVTELTWLLATVTSMGLLERAHSYKEKVSKGITPNVGLFTYPLLMAADILAPQADLVPVGADQDQHVEMTRDIAQAFNQAFAGDDPVFRLPATKLSPTPRVPGTTFEKGKVLQVAAVIDARGSDGRPVEIADYARACRAMVADVLARAAPGALDTTEQLAQALDERALPGFTVRERTLRVAAQSPGLEPHVVPRDASSFGVELWVELDRVVFATEGGRRVAAKMSKSYGNTIEIFAEGKPLEKTVKAIETRAVELADPLDPDEDLVMQLFRLFATPAEVADLSARYRAGGFGFGNAKKALLQKIDAWFAPFRQRRRELEADPDFVEDVLVTGARKARAVARHTLARAREATGIGELAT